MKSVRDFINESVNSDKQRERTVKQIIAVIKRELKQNTNVPQVKIEVQNTSLNGYTCDIFIGDSEWEELNGSTMSALKAAIKEIKDVNVLDTKDIYFGRSMWDSSPSIPKFPTHICVFGKPCAEFKQLARMVLKKYNINLGIGDLYRVKLFGKSGSYGEYGNRIYIAYSTTACQKYINYIKSFGRKKTTCKFDIYDDVDDLEYSSRERTECDGYRERTLVIKTV